MATASADSAYLQHLQAAAREKRLWEHRHWQVLVHYRPRLAGSGLQSQVDDPAFFLSPAGKYDPQAELHATLAGFFEPPAIDGRGESPRCRYPARYQWLKQELGFDEARLPPSACPEFDRWLTQVNPEAVTLVFPAAFLNNPASMFGHTLLRIDSRTRNAQTRLLDVTINYAAATRQERGLSFALKGLFGGYPGRFSVAPYYALVKQYGDMENRDIWEYRLNFSEEEVLRLLRHAWELRSVYFDYFFIDENCSYQLLSLLEAARPSLRLLDRFDLWAVPADTVRAVADEKDLISSAVFRPSRKTVLQERAERLGPDLQHMAQCIGLRQCPVDALFQIGLSAREQARVLELAIEEVSYRSADAPWLTDLLRARSAVDAPPQTPPVPTPSRRPDQGHPSSRAGVGYGYENERHFIQLGLRPVLHDWLDPPAGYIEGAQLEFLDATGRYYPSQDQLELEHLDFVDILSIPARSRFIHPLSWKANFGLQRRRVDDQDRPITIHGNAGAGITHDFSRRGKFFLLAEAMAIGSDRFAEKAALGAGPAAGLRVELTEGWRLGAEARMLAYVLGGTRPTYELALEQAIDLTPRSSLRLRLSTNREFGPSDRALSAEYLIYF